MRAGKSGPCAQPRSITHQLVAARTSVGAVSRLVDVGVTRARSSRTLTSSTTPPWRFRGEIRARSGRHLRHLTIASASPMSSGETNPIQLAGPAAQPLRRRRTWSAELALASVSHGRNGRSRSGGKTASTIQGPGCAARSSVAGQSPRRPPTTSRRVVRWWLRSPVNHPAALARVVEPPVPVRVTDGPDTDVSSSFEMRA